MMTHVCLQAAAFHLIDVITIVTWLAKIPHSKMKDHGSLSLLLSAQEPNIYLDAGDVKTPLIAC